MERIRIMLQIKAIYEKLLDKSDLNGYHAVEQELDNYFKALDSLGDQSYTDAEKELLEQLFELNKQLMLSMSRKKDQMDRANQISPKVSSKYDSYGCNEAYFIDQKF
ncbi:hypothetical protein [Paenibacillus sp. RC84]|uniref:hypothetical protein n=1 Tax=Paenibacillus sp. RC84 TaxID=3156252 RepID=UPI003511E92B